MEENALANLIRVFSKFFPLRSLLDPVIKELSGGGKFWNFSPVATLMRYMVLIFELVVLELQGGACEFRPNIGSRTFVIKVVR